MDSLKETGDMEQVPLPEPAKAGQPVLQDVINNTTEPNPEPVMDEKEKRKPLCGIGKSKCLYRRAGRRLFQHPPQRTV